MLTKFCQLKAVVFVVMYRCESYTIKKAECLRIDAFKLWVWRRLLRVPWTARRSNQSISKDIYLNILWKDWCWSWSSNILAPWCKEPTHWKRPLCWERLEAKGERGSRGLDASPTRWTWIWANSGRYWRTGEPGVLQSMGSHSVRHDWVRTTMSDPTMPLLGICPKGSRISKRYLHTHVHCSIIHDGQEVKQFKRPPVDEWIKKMWYLHKIKY